MIGSTLPAAGRDWHYNCSAKRMIDLNYAPAPPMDPSEIYAKTELGLAELRDRKLNLPITLRGLTIPNRVVVYPRHHYRHGPAFYVWHPHRHWHRWHRW